MYEKSKMLRQPHNHKRTTSSCPHACGGEPLPPARTILSLVVVPTLVGVNLFSLPRCCSLQIVLDGSKMMVRASTITSSICYLIPFRFIVTTFELLKKRKHSKAGITNVPTLKAENINVISGRVMKGENGGFNYVVLTLAGDNHIYYINRGLERALDPNRLAQQLEGKQVKLYLFQGYDRPLTPSIAYSQLVF